MDHTKPITDENAAYRIACLMMELADTMAAFPQAEPDVRAWQHLLVYAPKDKLSLCVSGEDGGAAADAFWKYWRENGETHKHGYYESTWGAINRALRTAGVTAYGAPSPLPREAMPEGGKQGENRGE